MKFRKKPVVVEAEQFRVGEPLPFNDRGPVVCYLDGKWYVTTIHGEKATLADGDWVIMEPRGRTNAYPCKPDIFEATYERVTKTITKSEAAGLASLRKCAVRLVKLIDENAPGIILASEVALVLSSSTLAFGHDLYVRLGERAIETARRHWGYCQTCETELNPIVTYNPICEQCEAQAEKEYQQTNRG